MKFNSKDWKDFAKSIQEKIKQADEKNRDVRLDEFETAAIRGEIKAYLWILQAPDRQASEQPVSEDNYP
jgi:hypothetical protein